MSEIFGVSPDVTDFVIAVLVAGVLMVVAVFVNGSLNRKTMRETSAAQIQSARDLELERYSRQGLYVRTSYLKHLEDELAKLPSLATNRLASAVAMVQTVEGVLTELRGSLRAVANQWARIQNGQVLVMESKKESHARLTAQMTSIEDLIEKYSNLLDNAVQYAEELRLASAR